VDPAGLLSYLDSTTGDLQPGDAGADALHNLRKRLALSVRNAALPPSAGPLTQGAACLEAQLRLAIAESREETLPVETTITLVRRDTPLPLTALQPDQGAFDGQAASRVYGPFLDALDRRIWFDEFLTAPNLRVMWAGQASAALVLPSVIALPGATHLSFGPCSIWVLSRMLASTAPAGVYAGWKAVSATVDLSAAGALAGNALTLPEGATIHLTIAPDNSELAPPPGPGVDAGEASVERPSKAEFFLTSAGLTSLPAAAAKITILAATVALVRSPAAPVYDPVIGRVSIPFTPDHAALHVTAKSTLCTVSGTGKIVSAGWCPTSSNATPDLLGDAGSGGMFAVQAQGSLQAASAGLVRGPLQLGLTYMLIDRGLIGCLSPFAENRVASYSLSLWDESSLRLSMDQPFAFLFLSSRAAMEVAQYRGTLEAALSQPKQADGRDMPLRFDNATLTLGLSATGLTTAGTVSAQMIRPRTALALSNGLFTVTPATQLTWNAQLSSPSEALSGIIELSFGVYQLLPILPDPYAASFDIAPHADAPRGQLRVKASWGADGKPQLDMIVIGGAGDAEAAAILPQPRFNPLPDPDSQTLHGLFQQFAHQRGFLAFSPESFQTLRLLDLSTNADQLGVELGYTPGGPSGIQIRGADVVSFGGTADILMLPQTHWEPVQVVQNPEVGILPAYLASPDDGGPTLIGANTVKLVPVAPTPLLAAIAEAFPGPAQLTGAFFTLPFGIRAVAQLNPGQNPIATRAGFALFRQPFVDSYTSAAQVRLTAAPGGWRVPDNAAAPFLVREPPLLPGYALQTTRATDQAGTPIVYFPPPPAPPVLKPPPFSVLEPIDQDFNATFGPASRNPKVPITRVDLSGYGESCFSDWSNDVPIGITNVQFQALVGRTRYEVIRMKSILVPSQAVVVRTITLERRGSGNVYRWDSGWQPLSDGLFDSADLSVKCHTGAVRGFYNIRRIRDTPGTITLDGGNAEVEAVYFDTDIAIDSVVKGADPSKRVPAVDQLGFVQRVPRNGSPPVPLTPAQMSELLTKYDPVGGAFDCTLDIGNSGQQMRVTGAYCSAIPAGAIPEFAVACYGALSVPRNEQWTVVRVANGSDVSAVDPHRGAPLTRQGGTPRHPPSGNYRIQDPVDLLNPSPVTDYGLQFTTATNRLLFLRPEIPDGGTQIVGSLPPFLADPYSLVGEGGLFPPLGRCLKLNLPSYALDLAGGVFRWRTPAGGVSFTIPDLGGAQRFLVKSGAFDMLADYAGSLAFFDADGLSPWGINIPSVPAALNIKTPFKADSILQVVNDLVTPQAAGLMTNAPRILFGEVLKDAQEIITALQEFLPGPPPIEVHLSTPTLDDPALGLQIVARFPIAQADGSAIDIGIGKFRGEISVGTEVQLTLVKFGGRIFFTVTGELQQPLLPKIAYVGGSMSLQIWVDETGSPAVRLATSAVASIGGDVIPGLVALEGSVSYGAFLDTSIDPFLPGVQLGMEVRAKLLSGLLGVRFRADAAVGMKPLGGGLVRDILIQGQIRAQGSVEAVYVFEEDFDKTLSFQQKVPGLVAGAFLVATGLVPVPV
jgi:hypothetical protein